MRTGLKLTLYRFEGPRHPIHVPSLMNHPVCFIINLLASMFVALTV